MKKSVLNIFKQIDKLKSRLNKIQTECQHLNIVKTYGADTGNYDPSDDRYWTDFHCLECDKKWTKVGSV